MEKEPQPDSLTDVTVKQYAPSEVYSSEPPPAYHRPQSASVQVAKIIALTVVAVSVVLGSFILAAAYVQANATCTQWQQEMELLHEEQRLQQNYQQPPLQPEALTQEEPQDKPLRHEDHPSDINTNKLDDDSISDSSESDDNSSEEENHTPIHIKLPLQLDFDEIAGALMDKNQRSRMNCIVEKKKAEEVIDHQPKTVRLPFGLNLTTDPRYEHVTGERMAIFCESGDEQRQMPQQQEETMMVQPIIVPLGGPMMPFHHMPQQHQQQRPEQMDAIRAHTIIMEQLPPRQSVPVPAQHQMPPQPQTHPNQIPPQMQHPNPIMHHIAQQIVAQHEMAMARQHQEQQQQQQQHQQEHEQDQQASIPHPMRAHQIPIPEALLHRLQQVPEEILTQINRLPNQEHVISVSVQEQEAEEVPQEEVRIVQHPRESAQEMNGRQSYARGLPMHIPVPVMQVQQMQQEQQGRPHYVQPRSVRSVDNILHREKRVKRCSCDCAC